jgi:hypothetical protein
MLIIPIQTGPIHYDLLVVLEADNVARLKQYDPAEIIVSKLGGPWAGLRLDRVRILYANADETRQLVSMHSRKDAVNFINKVLARGWKYRPELGDDDGNYQQPAKQ